ncbi:hypothetical protein TGPRC2_311890 [Toxoplasma gondii TgCatPRC2]|uniref:Uncharacterized protein n=1 Tax=Toxoplasma gondii TgCatPRC2 TaxID=1130821 RepID=A0A151HKJ4_TOXGO|nr:hypothetical protein TGPRC2_311890 [Toxoplasma gondii TgCatPRC2]
MVSTGQRPCNRLRALQAASEGRRKSSRGQGELLRVLRQQRVFVDERAIHFVSEGRGGPRADARNSVFKLQNTSAEQTATEQVQSLREKFSVVHDEGAESGDEGWGSQYANVPEALKTERGKSILAEQNRDQLLDAIENIEAEAGQLPEDTVTREEIDEAAALNQVIQRYSVTPDALSPQQLEALAKFAEYSHSEMAQEGDYENSEDNAGYEGYDADEGNDGEGDEDDDDDDDEDFSPQQLNKLNDMQREFLANNMVQWMESMEAAYTHGVILMKINCLGVAFIRNVTIKDCLLTIAQPTNWLQTSISPRRVALTSIESVALGRNSREFEAMEQRIYDGQLDETLPSPNLCSVVHLPADRTLSLVFVDEEHRNGFVFFLRVMVKRAKQAEQVGAE